MANKNTCGSLVYRAKEREDRFVDKIDQRTRNGEDRENVDEVWKNHTINEDGSRSWSF